MFFDLSDLRAAMLKMPGDHFGVITGGREGWGVFLSAPTCNGRGQLLGGLFYPSLSESHARP